jgi:hypothetical protein
MVETPARETGRNPNKNNEHGASRMVGTWMRRLALVFLVAFLVTVGLSALQVAAARAEVAAASPAAGPARADAGAAAAVAPGMTPAFRKKVVAAEAEVAAKRADEAELRAQHAAGRARQAAGAVQTVQAAQSPQFQSSIAAIDEHLEKELRQTGMWSEQAPVGLSDLRVLRVSYWGFDDEVHSGRLIVNQAWAVQLGKVFHKIFDARFPIRRMDPVDYLGQTGQGLVASDDTLSFNGRKMRGSSSWSMHAYGLAVDIDPAENPYVNGNTVIPEGFDAYLDRTRDEEGMLHSSDVVVEAFESIGWKWGGDWTRPKDYMHFSSTGK